MIHVKWWNCTKNIIVDYWEGSRQHSAYFMFYMMFPYNKINVKYLKARNVSECVFCNRLQYITLIHFTQPSCEKFLNHAITLRFNSCLITWIALTTIQFDKTKQIKKIFQKLLFLLYFFWTTAWQYDYKHSFIFHTLSLFQLVY